MQISRRHENTDPASRVPCGAGIIGYFRFVQLIAALGNQIDSDDPAPLLAGQALPAASARE
jgi:hypothetical protein